MTVGCLLGIPKQLSRFLRAVAGRIVIAWAGESVAHRVSLARTEPRRPGLARGRLTEAFFEPLPEDELAAWQQ